nr:homeobox protein knotted-1-like LET6 isoform X1 [Tanacetum cinerariifolium]
DPLAQRIRRGINRIQDLPVGESVEFNKFGQVVGKWQFMFGKYVGTRTRRLISILKKNWKDVTKEEKNFLWSDIKAQAASELSQSSNESKAGVDSLIMVLGPKHRGRTRGVGCDIGYKKGVEGYVRKTRTSEQRKDNEEIHNEVRQQMKEELNSSNFCLEMREELRVELRNEILAEHNLSPREDDVPSSVLKSSLNLTINMVRNESQGQQNESFSPRQDHKRLNLSSTKSIVRDEQQGEHNESSSTKPVDVLTSIFKIQCIKGTSKPLVTEVPTKSLMPQHERAPSSKKGKVDDTPKEPNKKDKASEDTTNKQKLIQRVENEKAANQKRL